VTTEIVEEIVEHAMARPPSKAKSAILFGSGLGRRVHAFDEDEVIQLLRAAVEHEGGQRAFANRHGVDRSYVNMILNGRARVTNTIAKALGLRRMYVAE
jgi:hypothetical protein